MKQNFSIFSLLLLAFLTISVKHFAQAPLRVPYQTIVRDGSGSTINSSPVGVRFSILQGSISGTVVYEETQTSTTTSLGLLNLEIGAGTPSIGTMNAINWQSGSYFLKVDVDPTGGTNYTISGTSSLNSVPYALHAKTSGDWLNSGNNLSNTNSGNVGIGTSTPSEKLEVNGNIRFTGNTFKRLGNGSGTSAGASGGSISIDAGSAFYSGAGASGGDVTINGGNSNSAGGQAGGNIIFQTGRNYWNNGFNPNALHGDIIFKGGLLNGGTSLPTAEFMRMIGSNGFLGIGTSLPRHRLHVGPTTTDNQQVTIRGYGSTGAWGGAAAFGNTNASVILGETSNTATIGGHNANLSAWTDLAINPNAAQGNVGIGTFTPTAKLDVNGTTKTVNFQMPTGASNGYLMSSDASGNATWVNPQTAYSNGWLVNGTDVNASVTGNVGIGTTTPSAKLEVAGNLKTTNFQMTTGAAANKVLVSNAAGDASWGNVSGTIASTVYNDGSVGVISDNTAYQFIGSTVTVTITAGQKIEVIASAGLGTTAAAGAQMNRIAIGYQTAGGTIFDQNSDWTLYKIINGQRDVVTLNTIFTNLPAGTYTVGMAYVTATGNAANFNANDWTRVSAKVINP